MKDKFRFNSKIAIPAAFTAIILLTAVGLNQESTSAATNSVKEFNLILILPYILVIVLSLIGLNVFVVLFAGLAFAGILGFGYGSFDFIGFAKKTYEGFTSMTEIFMLSLLTGGLAALVEKAGGISFLIKNISKIINSKK
ncbi:MAG: Na+/H+ antiporter NhaC family protein, partial [Chryseobacterium sp.]|nr:Na+/H+ antiporter NhaC family protein [Chryseobacterium sp.]